MALTPTHGNYPRNNPSSPSKAVNIRDSQFESPYSSRAAKPVNMKERHVHGFRRPTTQLVTPVAGRASTPPQHRFGISVLLDDGSASYKEHLAPTDLFLEDICACFGRGTLIATQNGQSAIEDLKPGDLIKTRDAGLQAIRWLSSCMLPKRTSEETGLEQVIRIKSDALGELRPIQDLVVSPRFRLLTNHPSCEALFGSPETLAPAIDLLDGDTILQTRPAEGLEFFNLMFDKHQIIEANGLQTESYHPGNFGVAVMSMEMQSHLRQIFPHLKGDLNGFGRTARPILKGFEAEVLRVG